jgi:hypothetical protein
MLPYTHWGNINDFAQLFNRKAVASFQKLDNTVSCRVIIKNGIHNVLKNNIKKRFCKLVYLKINKWIASDIPCSLAGRESAILSYSNLQSR